MLIDFVIPFKHDSFDTLKAGFEAIAAETGYSTTTIVNNYGKYKREIKNVRLRKKGRTVDALALEGDEGRD